MIDDWLSIFVKFLDLLDLLEIINIHTTLMGTLL